MLYRFSIKANNGDLAIYKFQFDVSSSTQQATTSTYGLYVYDSTTFTTGLADQGFNNGLINYGNCVNGDNKITNTTQTPGVNNSPLQVMIYPDKGTTACAATTTYTIPSGATRWFQLKGTIAQVETGNTVTDQVSVRISGDAAFPTATHGVVDAMRQASIVETDGNNDFIWSPISTTTAVSRFDLDFTNGYGIFDDQDYEYFSSN